MAEKKSKIKIIDFEKVKNALESANRICIISHRGPDGDAVGSNLALKIQLEKLGKTVISACVDPVPENSLFLLNANKFVSDFNYADFDLFVSVDCAALSLMKFHEKKPELLSGEKVFINIDHHSSNDNFGNINIVDGEAPSTSTILYSFFNYANWDIDRETATCLLHGIYFDTGSLMHSNTTSYVYEVCGELIKKGADLKKIVKNLFKTIEINKLRLWGRILERAYINSDSVVISAVNQEDLSALNTTHKDTGGAIDYLNAVPDSKYCVLLSEDDKGVVKGSIRTQRDEVNVSDVASKFGGGGHPKASGFGISGKLKPVVKWQVVNENEPEKSFEF
ncbi:MAG: bifunctional oligoribonuclease/PAP phosphatase NrnA [Candidatus Gracilibacteria bacterium]|jgi:phosphoesterase RecJ-like protein|nr:bifunctional oligoribonuclease/PAP phosphatase NrnA [Candidatus Gracilibacteria bacterium]